MTGRRGRTLAIVQARTSSSRLPGKVLRPLAGVPMVLRQLERIGRAETVEGIVIATSEDPSDDELAALLSDSGYDYIRGSLDDVLARYLQAIDEYHPDVVVRLTADCPMISSRVIDLVVERFHASDADYVSNTMVPTYPDGLDVEVVSATTLQVVGRESAEPAEREHVTLGVYRQPERFTIENVKDPTGRDHSDLRWTVDTAEDFTFVSQVFEHLHPLAFEYEDVLSLLDQHPELHRTHRDAPRNVALDGMDTGVMKRETP